MLPNTLPTEPDKRNIHTVIPNPQEVTAKMHGRFQGIDLSSSLDVYIGPSYDMAKAWLHQMVRHLEDLPSRQRELYFEKPEYTRLMDYVRICPNNNPNTRGSVAGALEYLDTMWGKIEGGLKQLKTATEKRNYMQNEPSVIAFKSWLDLYAIHNIKNIH